MDQRRNIELIILEVLGCLDETDRKTLQVMKETDENFPWKVLADYQNLSALLPSILNIAINPSPRAKEIMVKKLHSLIFTDESIHQPTKDIRKKINSDEEQLEKVISKSIIDWGSLSFSDSSPKDVREFREVKPKTPVGIKESVHLSEISEFSNEEKLLAEEDDKSAYTTKKTLKSSPLLKKYILISIILFVISASIFTYLLLRSKPETSEVLTVNKPTDTTFKVIEELQFNNLPGYENVAGESNNQKVETLSKTKNEQNVLPKAPPKLSDPIETPLIETGEVLAEEETKVGEDVSVPPPKEVI